VAVIRSIAFDLSPSEFSSAFREAAVGFYEGALELLRKLSVRHRLLSFSNTNVVQWPNVLRDLGQLIHFTPIILRI
jgi:FMN phosphatase YigB (HAD superfamily)